MVVNSFGGGGLRVQDFFQRVFRDGHVEGLVLLSPRLLRFRRGRRLSCFKVSPDSISRWSYCFRCGWLWFRRVCYNAFHSPRHVVSQHGLAQSLTERSFVDGWLSRFSWQFTLLFSFSWQLSLSFSLSWQFSMLFSSSCQLSLLFSFFTERGSTKEAGSYYKKVAYPIVLCRGWRVTRDPFFTAFRQRLVFGRTLGQDVSQCIRPVLSTQLFH